MNNKWIQAAHPKKGALSRQLGISESKNIPISLLLSIKAKMVGTKIKVNKKIVPITKLLKRRVNFAINVKRLK